MSDYTPTTEEVREEILNGRGLYVTGEDFDRWLAAHDAEIRADEREKAAQRVVDAFFYYYGASKTPSWLIAAARGGEQE